MQVPRLVVIDDDEPVRDLFLEICGNEGFQVIPAPDGPTGLLAVEDMPVQAVVTDLKLPGMDGLDVLERVAKIDPKIVTIVTTGQGTIDEAVRAMKAGAFDFITKPFTPEAVRVVLRKAIEYHRLRQENDLLRRAVRDQSYVDQIVGTSDAFRSMMDFIDKVADSDSTILIQGESGTGKEMVARLLHATSPRRDHPLVPVNCGAIPEALLESELFGHEKGAFSGALYTRRGRFEMAHGGTIFLDEVAELPPNLQVKLLRVLQERSFERVGGNRSLSVDVRVIAATNCALEHAVHQGRFRSDLFYRLNVIPITLPPLRSRPTDIPLLVDHFIAQQNKSKRGTIQGVSSEAMLHLVRYQWPGNVRQLENIIERAVVLKKSGWIEVSDLPQEIQHASASLQRHGPPLSLHSGGIDLAKELDRYEDHLIRLALEQANGVKSKAAELLQLNRTTLVEKLKRKSVKPRLVQPESDRSRPSLPVDPSQP